MMLLIILVITTLGVAVIQGIQEAIQKQNEEVINRRKAREIQRAIKLQEKIDNFNEFKYIIESFKYNSNDDTNMEYTPHTQSVNIGNALSHYSVDDMINALVLKTV